MNPDDTVIEAAFLAGPPTYPVLRALPLGATCPLTYEVKLAALSRALAEI